MIEVAELTISPEKPATYGAIVIPSYGMSKWQTGNEYRLTFFSGVVCRAAFEEWKDGVAPKVIILGGRVFLDDPKNDGDLMRNFLIRLGIPEDAIVQTRDATNLYNQLLHAKEALRELGIAGKVLIIHPEMQRLRISKLIKNYRINSDTRTAEDILSEKYPAFRHVWAMIKNDPTYIEKLEKWEADLARALKVDPKGYLARFASWVLFPLCGADVPDIRHRKTVRDFVGLKAAS